VLSYVLCNISSRLGFEGEPCPHVAQLQCGAGLSGLAAARAGYKVTLLDQNIARAVLYIARMQQVNGSFTSADVATFSLFGEPSGVPAVMRRRGLPDIAICANSPARQEEQLNLVSAITQLIELSPNMLVLVGFAANDLPTSNYTCESEMQELMSERGFQYEVVCVGDVGWVTDSNKPTAASSHGHCDSDAAIPPLTVVFRDRTAEFVDAKNPLVVPFTPVNTDGEAVDRTAFRATDMMQQRQPCIPVSVGVTSPAVSTSVEESTSGERETHRVVLFYRPTAVGVCDRCKGECFLNPALLPTTRCVYHDSYFCLSHWDCCGKTGFSAAGCCEAYHLP
jgi:hypothetical protein